MVVANQRIDANPMASRPLPLDVSQDLKNVLHLLIDRRPVELLGQKLLCNGDLGVKARRIDSQPRRV